MSARERLGLYPPIEPFASGTLDVGDGHQMYYEECGNPRGKPVAIVHGGPGGGANATMRRFHDPQRYRIILFDQRGCGRSRPHASLEANTTWHLVSDMEQLRRHLGVERWQLFGGSWGSTLALAYAQSHPERVIDLVLRGIFLLRQAELKWFYQDGCGWIYPEAFEAFKRVIPADEQGDMISAYYKRLTDADREVQLAAARAWSMWEGSTLSMVQDPERVKLFGADGYAIAFARIECHYFMHAGFFDRDDELLHRMPRIRHLPATLIHGRYDVVTPLKNAFDLSKAWPGADLRIVQDAGHAMTEPGIVTELIAATRRYAASGFSA